MCRRSASGCRNHKEHQGSLIFFSLNPFTLILSPVTRNDTQEPQQVTLFQTSSCVRVGGRVGGRYFISSHSCLVWEAELGEGWRVLSISWFSRKELHTVLISHSKMQTSKTLDLTERLIRPESTK